MSSYACPHEVPLEEYCPECDAFGAIAEANSIAESLAIQDLFPDDAFEFQYTGGRAWCEDEYIHYLELQRNAE